MENDWRLNGQEEYLYGVLLKHINYIHFGINDHDHCEFCWDKFSDREGDLHKGYCTVDEYIWICEECYSDFHEMFDWKVIE